MIEYLIVVDFHLLLGLVLMLLDEIKSLPKKIKQIKLKTNKQRDFDFMVIDWNKTIILIEITI
jgi:hypothetical protein